MKDEERRVANPQGESMELSVNLESVVIAVLGDGIWDRKPLTL